MVTITKQPETTYKVRVGHVLNIQIAASGAGVKSYQWFKDGVRLSEGGTTDTLNLTYKVSDAGVYYCLVQSGDNQVETLKTIISTDTSAPEIKITSVSTPELFYVKESKPVDITVVASTSDEKLPLTYQWTVNSALLSDKPKDNGAVSVTHSDYAKHNGIWRCIVRSGNAEVIVPIDVRVERDPYAIVDTAEVEQTTKTKVGVKIHINVQTNTKVDLSWESKTETGDWTVMNGEHTDTIVSYDQETKTFRMKCSYIDIDGVKKTLTSGTRKVTRDEAYLITFTKQPEELSGSKRIDSRIEAKVTTTSNSEEAHPVEYYIWYKDNKVIPGERKDTFIIDVLKAEDAGVYKCQAYGKFSNNQYHESTHQTLTVSKDKCTITVTDQPTVETGKEERIAGVPFSLHVTATTNDPLGLSYQWQKEVNGKWYDIKGETTKDLTFRSPGPAEDGKYRCNLKAGRSTWAHELNTNETEKVTFVQKGATIEVTTQPSLVDHRFNWGAPMSMSVVATTDGFPLTYQWMRNGKPVVGATKSTYTVERLEPKHVGGYYCILKSGTTTMKTNTVDGVTTTVDVILNPYKKLAGTPLDLKNTVGERSKTGRRSVTFVGHCEPVDASDTVVYNWYKDGSAVGTHGNELTLMFNDATDSKIWYTAEVGEHHKQSNIVYMVGTSQATDHRYIHPLPHRETSFVYVGYWVIDQIIECNEKGIDWVKTPNSCPKYKDDIRTVVAAMAKYGDTLCLESRNGRVMIGSLLPRNK